MSSPSDKDTLAIFRELSVHGSEAALWRLHALYYPRLFAFTLSLVRVKETAEELASDVFVDIWEKRALLLDVSRPVAYLFVCARNKALRHLQRPSISWESFDDLPNLECALERGPHEMLISSEMLRVINEAIKALPPKCRVIFRLVKENDLKYKEVAELLHISEKTVENQMGIAFKKLSASIPFKLA
ncbi:RNA polymerase sigma-70 factor [Dinghuibacter silviterrae]|uniref:RNA polymerase sigma-70 factor (ECF subfamily) n=1 Tax=Dinghuibacter silviterrae TaxID=1539049 RepID=A0A4R8DRM7_9BACT|nr:RNA polymerase sigma-70 factor [Dinghuibacter silviterrae]TDX00864.1 RNA polymerase sigma-70 factor (ECF subfamily) [Dinghuibacter silviterrae]